MRGALIASAAIHLSLIAAAFVTLPSADPFATTAVDALPVELVSIAEVSDLTVGEIAAQAVVEDAAEKTIVDDAPAEPDATPGVTDEASERSASDPDAILSPTESAAPLPVAEPEPVTAEPQPEPQEQEVAALPEAAVETVPEQAADAPAEVEARVPETVVPSRKPPPPPKRAEPARVERAPEEAFDADRVSALINRTAPTGGGTGSSQATLGTDDGRREAAQSLTWTDALKAQIEPCFSPPMGAIETVDLIVWVIVDFGPDGAVHDVAFSRGRGPERFYGPTADAAHRALIACQPYRVLPSDQYDIWRKLEISFEPNTILR